MFKRKFERKDAGTQKKRDTNSIIFIFFYFLYFILIYLFLMVLLPFSINDFYLFLLFFCNLQALEKHLLCLFSLIFVLSFLFFWCLNPHTFSYFFFFILRFAFYLEFNFKFFTLENWKHKFELHLNDQKVH